MLKKKKKKKVPVFLFPHLWVRKAFSLKWKTQLITLTLEVSVTFNPGEMKKERGQGGKMDAFQTTFDCCLITAICEGTGYDFPSPKCSLSHTYRKVHHRSSKITIASCTQPSESEQGHRQWHEMSLNFFRSALKSSWDWTRWWMSGLFNQSDGFIARLLTCTRLLHAQTIFCTTQLPLTVWAFINGPALLWVNESIISHQGER